MAEFQAVTLPPYCGWCPGNGGEWCPTKQNITTGGGPMTGGK